MASQQKLGMSLENKTSENWSYKKMSTEKDVHINLYLYMKINLRKIQMILAIDNSHCSKRKSYS